jgi:hypothetical protein
VSGETGKSRKPTEIDRVLLERVHQHGVGQRRKRRRSQYPKESQKPPQPSFTTTLKLKRDSRTGEFTQGGEITIPSHTLNQFPSF